MYEIKQFISLSSFLFTFLFTFVLVQRKFEGSKKGCLASSSKIHFNPSKSKSIFLWKDFSQYVRICLFPCFHAGDQTEWAVFNVIWLLSIPRLYLKNIVTFFKYNLYADIENAQICDFLTNSS